MKIGFICSVIEDATDTELIFLLLKQQCKLILWHKLYISLVREFVNIKALMNKLGVKASYILLSQHAVTGCDTVGKFNRISKEYYENHTKLKNELVGFQITESLTKEIEDLICET